MFYTVYCSNNPCGYAGQKYIADISVPGNGWCSNKKDAQKMCANVAYSKLEIHSIGHSSCQCKFEVIEIQ